MKYIYHTSKRYFCKCFIYILQKKSIKSKLFSPKCFADAKIPQQIVQLLKTIKIVAVLVSCICASARFICFIMYACSFIIKFLPSVC